MLDHLPLNDLRVLDLSQGIAGPSCGGLFAEYGARVIKIEPTGGDWMRALGPGFDDRSAGFMYYNRGKESLALDLKHEGALDVVLAHAEHADVLIENNRPGVTERRRSEATGDHPERDLSRRLRTGPRHDVSGQMLKRVAGGGVRVGQFVQCRHLVGNPSVLSGPPGRCAPAATLTVITLSAITQTSGR